MRKVVGMERVIVQAMDPLTPATIEQKRVVDASGEDNVDAAALEFGEVAAPIVEDEPATEAVDVEPAAPVVVDGEVREASDEDVASVVAETIITPGNDDSGKGGE